MRDKLGSILIGLLLAVIVGATMLAGYYGSTVHADTKVCKTQVYILSVVDDLAQTARVLVEADRNLDPAVRQAFVNHYKLRHRQIVTRIQNSGCKVPTQGSKKG